MRLNGYSVTFSGESFLTSLACNIVRMAIEVSGPALRKRVVSCRTVAIGYRAVHV